MQSIGHVAAVTVAFARLLYRISTASRVPSPSVSKVTVVCASASGSSSNTSL